jgi:hypothetical protein
MENLIRLARRFEKNHPKIFAAVLSIAFITAFYVCLYIAGGKL